MCAIQPWIQCTTSGSSSMRIFWRSWAGPVMCEVTTMNMQQFVWDIEHLDALDSARFGGKATGLARMVEAGIPVPPAFAIGTDAFHVYRQSGKQLPQRLIQQVREAMDQLGGKCAKSFNTGGMPLLVSVRSGAQVSMPGMMDTVLNLGLDARAAWRMIEASGNSAFVIDTWMRFWRMYADIVLGLDGEEIIGRVTAQRTEAEASPSEATLSQLEMALVRSFEEDGEQVSLDPHEQLLHAVKAVFDSWDSSRAKAYRKHLGISDDLGTAVTVQAMVFGNSDANSGSGVAFTRNPNTGERKLYGEYLTGRQGEDLVSGESTPVDLAHTQSGEHAALCSDLEEYGRTLEAIYHNSVDIEFTVESGTLYLLQVRAAKCTASAAVKIANDLVREGLILPRQALTMVTSDQLKRLLRPTFETTALSVAQVLTNGIGSSPGHAAGVAVLDADRAAELAASGQRVILLRPTTSPMDIRGMLAAQGIVTAKGGGLSHAAVVSRAQDKPCVVGCESIQIDLQARTFEIDGKLHREGDYLSIDGAAGIVYAGDLPLTNNLGGSPELIQLLAWADELSQANLSCSVGHLQEIDRLPSEALSISVIGMTDVAETLGLIDDLVSAVAKIGQTEFAQADATDLLCSVAEQIGRWLLEKIDQGPIYLRLPRLSSERARNLVPGWSELDPRLHLPLGHPGFYRPILKGLEQACQQAEKTLTVLLSGVTETEEWQRYACELEAFPALKGGVSINSVAGLASAPEMHAQGACLWLDMDQIVRSSHGFLAERYFSSACFDEFLQQGVMSRNPRSALKPFLKDLLAQLGTQAAQADACVGVDCALASDLDLVQALYQLGYRHFGIPLQQWQLVRLRLGQAAS
ncbi:pyruvate, phosphate dikinase [Pseudomonas abietaniphila]|uniref:pyruvate, phosphate dikinase n=1 Tax=Pseudomonas abietaniphila TaxID=89065 RepID=UPI0009E46E4D|nr:pyruvate, phosphate dikinase [Pseudomonas abietaniphila]